MHSAVPGWLTPVAWTYLALSVLSAVVIAADVYLARRRHPSAAAELVWITAALYLGPFAVLLYLSKGRTGTSTSTSEQRIERTADPATAVLPGGSASAVAHLIGVPLVAAAGWTIAGMAMWPMIIVIAVLAVVLLAAYERVAGHGHGHGHRTDRTGPARRLTVGAALLAAVVTVAAFDVGMVGWMLLLHVNDAMPPASESTFWFLMQIGVLVGLVTGYPAVRWLVRRGQAVVPA